MVNIAPSLSHVSDRAKRFFASKNPRMEELNESVIAQLRQVGRVVVVGGLARDLAFFGADERPISDIDFVVTGSPLKLAKIAARLGAVPNRFGGFGLKRGGVKVDFWALSRTWAKTSGHVFVRKPSDVVRATFFDWDAITYDIDTHEVSAIPRYIDKLNRRILDINLEVNPSLKGSLVRSLRRLVMWDARPGHRLSNFIISNINEFEWRDLVETEINAFHVTYLEQFDSGLQFRRNVLRRSTNYVVGVDSQRQQKFDF